MNNLKRLSNEFYRIQCMNWIKNVGKGYSSVEKLWKTSWAKLMITNHFRILME